MLLKYNINNIRQKRKLLDVNRVDVTKKDDCYIINVETKTPHNLKTNDVILLQHDIKNVSNYTEAHEKGKDSDIVFIEKPQTVIETDIKGDYVEVVYGSGYYQKINDKFRKIPQNSLSAILNKYNSFHDKLKVICDENDIFKFKIILKRYKELRVKSVTDSNEYGVFIVSGSTPMLLNKNDTFNVIRKTFKYEGFDVDNGLDNLLKVDENPNGKSINLGSDYVVFNGIIYVWTPIKETIQCTYINENTYSYSYKCTKHTGKEHTHECVIIEENDILEIEDTRFIIENKVDIKPPVDDDIDIKPRANIGAEVNPPIDGDVEIIPSISLNPNVKIYEYEEYINVSLPISSTNLTELNHELNTKIYFDEIKNELIPDIKDYEKKYFIPLYEKDGVLKYISKMNFNIFLRSRDKNDESWNTNDAKGWNQYIMDGGGNFSFKGDKYETENGDLLGYLGFTDEDIRYRKKKVDKSFLRLSFYNTPNPTTQMLLFYSTIFLDSGELYTKYIKNIINENRETGKQIVYQNNFDENNLTLSFSVTDRYDRTKSSEGFYLYLFPDGLENNKTRTLYMKVEFNHAGNGKTIPLIFPNNKKKPLKFNDEDFPKSLLTDDGDLTELYRQLYIPLTIEYSEERNEYFYYFDLTEFNEDKQEITFGLYEPKINPIN